MTLSQIEHFLMAAKYENITEAAERLYISQPTLSRQIRSVERELNMLLFERHGNSVKLTPAGLVLSERLESVLEIYKQAIEQAQYSNRGMSGRLKIGVLHGHIVGELFAEFIANINKRHGNISVDVKRLSFSGLVEGLLDCSLDFALTLDFDIANLSSVSYIAIETVPNRIAIAKSHPGAKLKNPSLIDFRNDSLIAISPKDSSNAYNKIINSCKLAGFTPVIKTAETLEEYMLLIEAGFGYAVLSERNSLFNNTNVVFLPAKELSQSDVVLVWNPQNPNPCLRSCVNIAKDSLSA